MIFAKGISTNFAYYDDGFLQSSLDRVSNGPDEEDLYSREFIFGLPYKVGLVLMETRTICNWNTTR